jgi:hypothetical protein
MFNDRIILLRGAFRKGNLFVDTGYEADELQRADHMHGYGGSSGIDSLVFGSGAGLSDLLLNRRGAQRTVAGWI